MSEITLKYLAICTSKAQRQSHFGISSGAQAKSWCILIYHCLICHISLLLYFVYGLLPYSSCYSISTIQAESFLCFAHPVFPVLEQCLIYQIRSDQSLSCVRLFATPWIAARQASLPITNSRSSLRLMSIESVMPSSHLILCRPLLLLPPSPPSIRVFSNESTLHMRWPKYWSFSFRIIPSKEITGT